MNIKFFTAGSEMEQAGGLVNPSGPGQQKGYEITVNGKVFTMPQKMANGEQILSHSGHLPVSCYSLYMKLAGCDFEKISPDREIDLANPGIEQFVTKDPDVFPYTVNKDPELTQEKQLTPRTILKNAGLDSEKVYLVETVDGKERVFAFQMDHPIPMNFKRLHFVTREWVETVDIEEYGKHCKEVPPAKTYLIKIDKDKHRWNSPVITVEEAIKLAHPTDPQQYNLIKFVSNSPKPIPLAPGTTIDLLEKCLLRLVTQPKTQNDGLRSGFTLPEEDEIFLASAGFQWEALAESNYMWLLIHDFSIPDGYNTKTCTVALMIPPGYPAAEIDMAYFCPQLVKISGRAINATTTQGIGGKLYQRWSRHRQPGQWRPGVDNVATHLTLVNNWLINDVNR